MTINLDLYLERIGLKDAGTGVNALRTLQLAQQQTVSFENLEPFSGFSPNLEIASIWDKIVSGGRGGYCLELNSLLAEVLRIAGFEIRFVMGRVRMGAPVGGPKSHLAIIARTGGMEFLVDAGFGGPGPREPIPFAAGERFRQGADCFRLREDVATGEFVLERQAGDGWFALYGFDRAPVTGPDIEAANFVCSFWSGAPFSSTLMINRHLPDGRASLMNTRLRIEKGGQVEDRIVATAVDLHACLREIFLLAYEPAEAAAIWERLQRRMAA